MKIIETNLTWKGQLLGGNVPTCIVVHNADAKICSVQEVHQWHLGNGWTGIGYHYFIRKDGSIYRGRPEWAQGAHALGYNTKSIGICLEGKFMVEVPTQEQLNSLKDLITDIRSRYKDIHVYGHKELNNTDCPGIYFPLSDIKAFKNNPQTSTTGGTGVFAELQALLNNAGYRDDNEKVLTIDNIPGQCTLSACAKCIVKYNANNAFVKWIQNRLNSVGYTCGIVDGIFGKMTLVAVQRFQRDKSLVADGIVGQNTWKKLLGL